MATRTVGYGQHVAIHLGRRPRDSAGDTALWLRRDGVDHGRWPGTVSAERERIRELEREVRERPRANEILEVASAFHAGA